MLVKPMKAQKMKPYALLVPGFQQMTAYLSTGEDLEARGPRRCELMLERLAAGGFVCYTNTRLADLRHTTGATSWTADIWRGAPTRMKHEPSGLVVSSLRGALPSTATLDPVEELAGAMAWLADQGIRPASLSSMAWSLWRRTLTKPFQSNFQTKIGKAALYGGRQSAEPANYSNQVQVDIQGAYPFAMISGPYASSLMEVSVSTQLDPSLPGLARATVHVPRDMKVPPLPRRLDRSLIRWDWGEITGTWTWRELVSARNAGADVELLRTWSPVTLVEPFAAWYDLQAQGRRLDHGSCIVKPLSTSLWGMFGMTADDTAAIKWSDEAGNHAVMVAKPPRTTPHEGLAHIAAETSSRVRSRLMNEALAGRDAPAHVDTDGVIIPAGSPMPANLGEGPGQWRVKSTMHSVEVRGPQVYRYQCCDVLPNGRPCTLWHYCTAGIPPHLAPRLFAGLDRTLNVSIQDQDYVLPSGDQSDARQGYHWATGVRRKLYGPPMIERMGL